MASWVRDLHLGPGPQEQAAPAIEYISGNPAEIGPAGFGAIDRSWSPRIELAGTYDRTWLERKKPLLPDDYDERHAQSSPMDQRSPLRGGERFELINLTPQGVLHFAVRRIGLGFTTFFGRRQSEHRGRLVTILVEPELMRLQLTWQTSLEIPPTDVDYLDETRIWEKQYI
jgi:hypothetical protein